MEPQSVERLSVKSETTNVYGNVETKNELQETVQMDEESLKLVQVNRREYFKQIFKSRRKASGNLFFFGNSINFRIFY